MLLNERQYFNKFLIEASDKYFTYGIRYLSMGNLPSQPQLQKHTCFKKGMGLSYAVSQMCGWRLYMEDAHLIVCPLAQGINSLFAVFDGHGGPQVACFVEQHFAMELQNNINYRNKHYNEALRQTFFKMDQLLSTQYGKQKIKQIQTQMRTRKNTSPYQKEEDIGGCTANVILITPNTIYCANVGDSRSVARIAGQTQQLSREHKPQDQLELNRIIKAGGTVVNGRINGGLNLSRSLGSLMHKQNNQLKPQEQIISAQPEIVQIDNKNVEFIVLGNNGIWETKSNNSMVEWMTYRLSQKVSQEKIVEELLNQLIEVDRASQVGKNNMTVILIHFDTQPNI